MLAPAYGERGALRHGVRAPATPPRTLSNRLSLEEERTGKAQRRASGLIGRGRRSAYGRSLDPVEQAGQSTTDEEIVMPYRSGPAPARAG
jgi:hypothetical protein